MRRKACLIVCSFLLVFSCLTILDKVYAGVDVNINIGLPPAFVISSVPEVVLIPGTYAYYVPDIGVDIIFYNGYWFRPYRDHWYRGDHYNGPWVHVVRESMPYAILKLPPDYRRMTAEHKRIPYKKFASDWKIAEKAGYRDNHNDYHDDHGRKGKKLKH